MDRYGGLPARFSITSPTVSIRTTYLHHQSSSDGRVGRHPVLDTTFLPHPSATTRSRPQENEHVIFSLETPVHDEVGNCNFNCASGI